MRVIPPRGATCPACAGRATFADPCECGAARCPACGAAYRVDAGAVVAGHAPACRRGRDGGPAARRRLVCPPCAEFGAGVAGCYCARLEAAPEVVMYSPAARPAPAVTARPAPAAPASRAEFAAYVAPACPACGKPADAPGNAACDNSCGTVYCSFGGRAPCATWHAEGGRAVEGHARRCGSESDEPAPDLTRACPTCGAAGGAPCEVRGGLFGCPCSTLTCPNGHLHFTAATGRGSAECRGRAGDCELYADDEAAF